MFVTTPGGIALMILGVLIIVGSLLLLAFGGPFAWWQVSLIILIILVGFGCVMGGSEIKR